MKKRPILLCALLLAGILGIGTAMLSGCSSEIRIEATGTATGTRWKDLPPWLLQYAPLFQPTGTLPETLPEGSYPDISTDYTVPVTGTLPPIGPVTTDPGSEIPPLPGSDSFDMAALLAHSSEDAAERAKALDWELLNGYIIPPYGQEDEYRALFNPENRQPTDLFNRYGGYVQLDFDRPVMVYGIELVFSDNWINSDFTLHSNKFSLNLRTDRDLLQQKDIPERNGVLYMDQNTLWLESTDRTVLYDNLETGWGSDALSQYGMLIEIGYGSYYNPPVQINLYGVSIPVITEPHLPANLPDDWDVVPRAGVGYLEVDYFNEYGWYIGTFGQYVPQMAPEIPDGITREFTVGNLTVTQLIHPDSLDLIDFYWSDGDYLYNLSGNHPDLLQVVFRSMGQG